MSVMFTLAVDEFLAALDDEALCSAVHALACNVVSRSVGVNVVLYVLDAGSVAHTRVVFSRSDREVCAGEVESNYVNCRTLDVCTVDLCNVHAWLYGDCVALVWVEVSDFNDLRLCSCEISLVALAWHLVRVDGLHGIACVVLNDYVCNVCVRATACEDEGSACCLLYAECEYLRIEVECEAVFCLGVANLYLRRTEPLAWIVVVSDINRSLELVFCDRVNAAVDAAT